MVTKLKEPTIPITEIEQSAFCQEEDQLRSKTLDEEFKTGIRWQKLPVSYMKVKPEEFDARIAEAKAALGRRLVILGHHYQRDEVIRHADLRGDSFKLSQYALHGRDRRNPKRPSPAGYSPQLDGRLLYGRHGPH